MLTPPEEKTGKRGKKPPGEKAGKEPPRYGNRALLKRGGNTLGIKKGEFPPQMETKGVPKVPHKKKPSKCPQTGGATTPRRLY